MKNLLTYFYSVFLFTLLSINNIIAQGSDSLIQLYPEFGDAIEKLDKEYYGIFIEYDDFDKAEFYIRDNKYFVTKIKSFRQSSLYDAILVQNLSSLDSLRSIISEAEMIDEQSDLKSEVVVITKTGDRYEGELEMFSKKYLYLYSDKSISTGGISHLRVKIPVSNVEGVILPGDSYTLAGMGFGALAGLLVGIGFAASAESRQIWYYDSKMLVAGFFVVLGAGIGALIGLFASTSDDTIEIGSTNSLIQLKELCRYNPGDKSPPGVKYFQLESL